MDEHNMRGFRHMRLSIADPQRLYTVPGALSNPLRVQMLQLMGTSAMLSVNGPGRPDRHADLHRGAGGTRAGGTGLIFPENMPGIRGTLKLSTRKVYSLSIGLLPYEEHTASVLTMRMPAGCYSRAGNILPTRGLAGAANTIGEDDNPRTFYHCDRFGAQPLWFRQGFVKYMFSVLSIDEIDIKWLDLSSKTCPEAPMYRGPWKNAISVSINGRLSGTWTRLCDCGERHGRVNLS